MKLLDVRDIRGGEILYSPIYTKESEILIPKGAALKKEYVDLLLSLNIKMVEIENLYSEYATPLFFMSKEKYYGYVKYIQHILENHIYKKRNTLSLINDLAVDLVDYIRHLDLDKIYDIIPQKPNLYEHTLNVTIVSLIIARKLKIAKDNYYGIAVGCLLHDLGIRYINVPYLNQNISDLSAEEVFEYKKHTVFAYTVLDKDETWVPGVSKNMILSHHEKMDGSGFPLKQKNQDIECRIIQVADAFDCLISGMECTKCNFIEATEYLYAVADKEYDKNVIDALFSVIARYPVGTEVNISNGRHGVVISQTGDRKRPLVMMTDLSEPESKEVEVLDLRDERELYII